MRRARVVAAVLLIVLGLCLAAAPSAGAQEYRFGVPDVQVVLTVQPDASILIAYKMTFQNQSGAHPIDVIDVGMPTKDYEVLGASIDGRKLTKWMPSTAIAIGPEVHLDSLAIQPGATGVFECQARVTDMVFEDRTDKQRASLKFTPTWFGDRYVVGETNLLLVVKFPAGVSPDSVIWHSGSPPFFRKGMLDPDNVAFVSWTARYRFTGPMMFGCSFPRSAMQRVVASNWWKEALLWWKQNTRAQVVSGIAYIVVFAVGFLILTQGTGITLLLICIAGFIFIMVQSPILHLWLWPMMLTVLAMWWASAHYRKAHYLPAVAKGEGGKICRGLTPVESAVLLELPLPQVLAMVITDLLNKGAIRTTNLKPLTVEALGKRAAPNVIESADATKITLEPYEVGFLDTLVAPPPEVEGKDFTGPLDKLVGLVKYKVAGFDVAATRAYYKDVTARAWDRVSHEQDPAKKDAMANQWMSWLTMDPKYDERMQEQTRLGWLFYPSWSWWPRTGYGQSWFHDLNRSVSGVAQRSAQALGGPNIKLDLSGVDRFTLNTLGDLAKGLTSGSGGGGCAGGGCACACAGCACACACAGGGR